MAGKLHLTQPRPAAMPADQGGQLIVLHDFSGDVRELWGFRGRMKI
jgi:hypothetical protein